MTKLSQLIINYNKAVGQESEAHPAFLNSIHLTMFSRIGMGVVHVTLIITLAPDGAVLKRMFHFKVTNKIL